MIFEELKHKAKYALESHDREIVYEIYGASKMARRLEAISKEEFLILNEMLIRNGINNQKALLR